MSRPTPAREGGLPLLVVQHVSWEVPHRIAAAFPGARLEVRRPLVYGDRLPSPEAVCGAVIMGGPMGVNDHLAGLTTEIRWIERALERSLPILGVCLGAQVLAAALGARVDPSERWELGWAAVEVLEGHDPVVGPLAPTAKVLHWHRDRCELPDGATLLARSDGTPCQAFRVGSAWGIQFHPEVDSHLVSAWLTVPTMAAQATAVLGERAATALLSGAAAFDAQVAGEMARGFGAFAGVCRLRQREVAA